MPAIGMSFALNPISVGISIAAGAPVFMPVPIVMWTGVFRTIAAGPRERLAMRVVARL